MTNVSEHAVRPSALAAAPARAAASIALLVAAVGIVIQIIGHVNYPTVPPGLIILAAGGLIVGAVRWRWISLIATAIGIFMLTGFFTADDGASVHRITAASHLGACLGTWVQMIGVVVALCASLVALVRR